MKNDASSESASSAERDYFSAVSDLLARPDYLLPLAAAERQFRDHYYGLNSAAMLEDLFVDALSNFLRQTRPSDELARPRTGQKGWDYSFNRLKISHKVAQKVDVVAALWDATVVKSNWSFEEPVTYVLASNRPSTLQVSIDGGAPFRARAIAAKTGEDVMVGHALIVVHWPTVGSARVIKVVETTVGGRLQDCLPFEDVWTIVAGEVATSGRANQIDVLQTTSRPTKQVLASLRSAVLSGAPLSIDAGKRSGIYFLSLEMLQNLPAKSNNRGLLVPKETVAELLDDAVVRGLFSPMPLWYWRYAQAGPPDLYASQRSEYDALFRAGRAV